MTTSSLTFLDFLKPRRNEAALRLRNSLLALAILFVITNLSSAFPSIFSSLTVVWNAVTPPPTPSKSRTGGNKNGTEVGFWLWTISLIGAYPTLERMSFGLEQLFYPFRRGKRVRTALDVDFPIRLRTKIPKRPIPTNAHTCEGFQYPSQLTGSLTDKTKDPFTHSMFPKKSNGPSCTHLDLKKVTPQKQKPFNPSSSTLSTSSYLTSPVSTPSRTLNYKFPAASPFNDSTNSNVSMSTSVPPSPSPLLSSPLMAYRGKHPQSAGSESTVKFDGTNDQCPTYRQDL